MERGLPILRQRTIGEVHVSKSEFSLAAIESETYSGSLRLQGDVLLDDRTVNRRLPYESTPN